MNTRNLAVAAALLWGALVCGVGHAQQDPTDVAAAKIDEKFGGNVKKLFATKCSWCHQGYGMKQADGPKLAGTSKSVAEVMARIVNGKTPMPGFKDQLSFEQIQSLAEYIKALPDS